MVGLGDPYGQLKDAVVTTAEALNVSLEGDARFTVQWVQRSLPKEPENADSLTGLHTPRSVIMVEPGPSTSPAMSSAMVSYRFEKVI